MKNGYLIELKIKLVMLHLGRIFWVIILLFIHLSCSKKNETKVLEDFATKYQRQNFNKYKYIYDIANDTIMNWIENKLDVAGIFILYPYQLDSALVFNKDSTRLYTCFNVKSSIFKNAIQDDSEELYGARIKGHWYFLKGAGLAIPRVFYQDSMYAPMTFKELSYVAHVNFIQNYLIKKEDGTYVADDEKINKYILNADTYGCYHCKTKAQNDSLFLAKVREQNAKRKPQKEINRILENASASIRPLEPPVDPKTGHGRTTWSTNDPKKIKFNEKVYYPEDTLAGPHPFYRKRNFIQKWLNPFQPRIFGRKNEEAPPQ